MTSASKGQGLPSTEYLYDFFYVDTARVSAFIVHFNNAGIPTTIKETDHQEDQSSDETKKGLTASGGASAIIKGNMGTDSSRITKTQNLSRNVLEKSYDPTLILPITLLDQLSESKYIHHHLESAGIGQLVLVSGGMSIVDFRSLENLWDFIADAAIAETVNSVYKTEQKKVKIEEEKSWNINKKILKALPYTVVARFANKEDKLFAVLEPQFIRMHLAALSLQHGNSIIPGEWFVLGVLDAFPKENSKESDADTSKPFLHILGNFLNGVKTMFGRYHDESAITPICIFRTITEVKSKAFFIEDQG